MLKNIVECKVPSSFTILVDEENLSGGDLLRAFLTNFEHDNVLFLCLENPPKLYDSCINRNKKIILFDFFSDPCAWEESSKDDLKSFLSKSDDFIGKVLIIDSLYRLSERLGFFTTFNILHGLRSQAENIISLLHKDLFQVEQLEDILTLAVTVIYVKNYPDNHDHSVKSFKKLVYIVHKKKNQKVLTQIESFTINDDFVISSEIYNYGKKSKAVSASDKSKMNFLTTFELGLEMKESEKKAKEQLILPYLRREQKEDKLSKLNKFRKEEIWQKTNKEKDKETKGSGEGGGDIIYKIESIDLEDDPDDDLDI